MTFQLYKHRHSTQLHTESQNLNKIFDLSLIQTRKYFDIIELREFDLFHFSKNEKYFKLGKVYWGAESEYAVRIFFLGLVSEIWRFRAFSLIVKKIRYLKFHHKRMVELHFMAYFSNQNSSNYEGCSRAKMQISSKPNRCGHIPLTRSRGENVKNE